MLVKTDALSEGYEKVTLGVANPTNGALLGTASTVLTISPSNPIVLDASLTTKFSNVFTDVDQDLITVKLTGSNAVAGAKLNVYGTDEPLPLLTGNVLNAPISLLELVGTDPIKSSLSLTVAKAKKTLANPNPNGDGFATIGGITGPGLKTHGRQGERTAISARPRLHRLVGTITMANVPNGAKS